MIIISNPPGRTMFLVITLLGLLFVGLIGVGIGRTDPYYQVLPILACIMAFAAFCYCLMIAFVGAVYEQRFLNIGVFCVLGLGMTIVEGFLLRPGAADGIYVPVVACLQTVYVFCLAGILAPNPCSDLAHRLHPFVGDADPARISANSAKKGRRRVKHREINIYENWPAPVPFTALAIHSYATTNPSELPFRKGDHLLILDCRGNWWLARLPLGEATGFVPSNYIRVLRRAMVLKSHEPRDPDEVPITQGETVEVMEVHRHLCLIRNALSKIGSVPTSCLQIEPAPPDEETTTPTPSVRTPNY